MLHCFWRVLPWKAVEQLLKDQCGEISKLQAHECTIDKFPVISVRFEWVPSCLLLLQEGARMPLIQAAINAALGAGVHEGENVVNEATQRVKAGPDELCLPHYSSTRPVLLQPETAGASRLGGVAAEGLGQRRASSQLAAPASGTPLRKLQAKGASEAAVHDLQDAVEHAVAANLTSRWSYQCAKPERY